MNLGLLLGLLLIDVIVIGYIAIAARSGSYSRFLPSIGDALIAAGLLMTGAAFGTLLVSMFPFQAVMDSYEFTVFAWMLINAALSGVFWYATVLYEDRQRRRQDQPTDI